MGKLKRTLHKEKCFLTYVDRSDDHDNQTTKEEVETNDKEMVEGGEK